MRGAPHGTVTFLFTDIESSTRLWEQWPDAMQSALAAHDRILRAAVAAHDGYVFSTAGDAFAVAFWTPEAAARAALAAQRELAREPWPGPAEVRVRMGLHTGTADERDGDYFGPAVNRAARIMSAGHGGQVLVSLATEELVRDRLGDGVAVADLGEHPLSGLSRRERVFQLSAPGLPARFPPLRTAERALGNVPDSVTSFVGRGAELERLVDELAEHRLLTLVGVGGVGKTRLALEAARQAADAHPDGVWFCELAPVPDPDAVAHAVGTTLTVRPQASLSMVDSVIDALRGRDLLLVLDNCEHVLDGAAALAARLTTACPTVAVLATSRESLGVPGERVRTVPPLEAGAGSALFRDRASAADASTPLPADDAVVRTICERLDGIPLAIELAAARASSMTLADLADRLDDRFRLLRRGRRSGLERHQTLRATVEWSYQLLEADERLVFDRLSTFAGGCDLRAAEAVAATAPVRPEDAADILGALVDKSMVIADRTGDRTRFRLLETLRQFGHERLREAGGDAEARSRHLRHFVDVACSACAQVKGTEYDTGMATFEAEWDNLRVALQWAVELPDPQAASDLIQSAFMFALWRQRHELGDWAEQVIALDDPGPAAYGIASKFAWLRGEHGRAVELARTGIAMATPETFAGLRICTDALGRALSFGGRTAEGWQAMQRFAAMFDPVTEPFDAAWALLALCGFAQEEDPAQLAGLIARAQAIAAPLANPAIETIAALASNWAASHTGDYADALDHLQRARASAERAGDRYISGFVQASICSLATMAGVGDPVPAMHDALRHLHDTRNWALVWSCLESIAIYWAGTDPPELSGVVIGYLRANGLRAGGVGFLGDAYDRRRSEVLAALEAGPAGRELMARGAGMGRTELVTHVLGLLEAELDRSPATRSAGAAHRTRLS